jgi:hypothetical protein
MNTAEERAIDEQPSNFLNFGANSTRRMDQRQYLCRNCFTSQPFLQKKRCRPSLLRALAWHGIADI